MCRMCDAASIWVCCGGVMKRTERCPVCGCTPEQDAAACERFEALNPTRIAAGDYPDDDELIAFKVAHGFGQVSV